jgi:hypothetical protein
MSTHVQQQRGSQEAETLTVSHLRVVDGVRLAHSVQRILTQTPGLLEKIVGGKRASYVSLDDVFAATLLQTSLVQNEPSRLFSTDSRYEQPVVLHHFRVFLNAGETLPHFASESFGDSRAD